MQGGVIHKRSMAYSEVQSWGENVDQSFKRKHWLLAKSSRPWQANYLRCFSSGSTLNYQCFCNVRRYFTPTIDATLAQGFGSHIDVNQKSLKAIGIHSERGIDHGLDSAFW
jgi:hypothetical protein